jgi:hypothetical protein
MIKKILACTSVLLLGIGWGLVSGQEELTPLEQL